MAWAQIGHQSYDQLPVEDRVLENDSVTKMKIHSSLAIFARFLSLESLWLWRGLTVLFASTTSLLFFERTTSSFSRSYEHGFETDLGEASCLYIEEKICSEGFDNKIANFFLQNRFGPISPLQKSDLLED